MSRDVLFLLEPGFADPKHPGQRFVCPHGLSIEGLLASAPEHAGRIDVKRVGFERPRHAPSRTGSWSDLNHDHASLSTPSSRRSTRRPVHMA